MKNFQPITSGQSGTKLCESDVKGWAVTTAKSTKSIRLFMEETFLEKKKN
jgi:hypothetical protein